MDRKADEAYSKDSRVHEINYVNNLIQFLGKYFGLFASHNSKVGGWNNPHGHKDRQKIRAWGGAAWRRAASTDAANANASSVDTVRLRQRGSQDTGRSE